MSDNVVRQKWLKNPTFDGIYILLPSFIALLVTILLPEQYKSSDAMPLVAWVVVILLIDVSHVYSTLFLTYLNPQNFKKHKRLYLLVPVVCYIVGVFLYLFNSIFFWRCIAYLAVFHFVRQQYGFMRLYARFNDDAKWAAILDKVMIYAATLYPIIFWHTTLNRNFNWFVDGDFYITDWSIVHSVSAYVYMIIIIAYVCKELLLFSRNRYINLPKNLVIIGTALSWYFGIVFFNGDMAFTLLNVVAHGIPYIALVWLFSKKGNRKELQKRTISNSIIIFLGVIVVLAYVEEGLWDGLVWKEHGAVFGIFNFLPLVTKEYLLALLIPLLSLPQITHYVLDGYIWKKGHMD